MDTSLWLRTVIGASLTVTPGQVLEIGVGGQGARAVDGATGTTAGGYGGINGDETGGSGGAGVEINATNTTGLALGGQGGGGGGASDIRTSSGIKLIVAGGGGGAGYNPCYPNTLSDGTAPEQGTGGSVQDAGSGEYGGENLGGYPGTTSAGGAAIAPVSSGSDYPLCSPSLSSGAGTFLGGYGGTLYPECSAGVCTTSYGGGGGGGGYYGGGGGCGGGGGSGNNYTGGAGVTVSGISNNGYTYGFVLITW